MSKVFVKKMENISFPEKQFNLLINQTFFKISADSREISATPRCFFGLCWPVETALAQPVDRQGCWTQYTGYESGVQTPRVNLQGLQL